jgi:hypothetical protein
MEIITKICTYCKKNKNINEFIYRECKECYNKKKRDIKNKKRTDFINSLLNENNEIKCILCNEFKQIIEFNIKNGIYDKCNECRKKVKQNNLKQYQKQYYINNKEYLDKKNKENSFKYKQSHQQYYINNKEKISEKNKEYRLKNKNKIRENQKKWEKNNKDKIKKYGKKYANNNKDKISFRRKEYRKKNKEILKIKRNSKVKIKRQTDIKFKLKSNVSRAIRNALIKNNSSKNNNSFIKYVNYTMTELKQHLESLFEPWMNWDNYGVYKIDTWDDQNSLTWTWQIDHIIPQSTLLYNSMEDINFKQCWAISNLRPYSAKQNLIDGNRRVINAL